MQSGWFHDILLAPILKTGLTSMKKVEIISKSILTSSGLTAVVSAADAVVHL